MPSIILASNARRHRERIGRDRLLQQCGECRFLAFVEFYRHRFGRPSGAPGCPMDRDTLIALIILVAAFVLLVVLLRK